MDALTFDQFVVFVNVVDAGSFSAAARRLNRAQSAITYAVQKLEDHLGTALFDRAGYRPSLNEAGRALLPRARRILDDVGRFRSQAQEFTHGLEAELRISVGAMIPLRLLAPALRAFAATFSGVVLRVTVEPFSMNLGIKAPAVTKGTADIRIAAGLLLPDILIRRLIGTFTLIDVAAPDHPLAAESGPVTIETLGDHLQVVLTERMEAVAGTDMGVAALTTWRVTDLTAKHALLLAGIGWGSLPDLLVAEDLAAGRLVRVPSEESIGNEAVRRVAVVAAHRRDEPLGPAGRWLFDRLAAQSVVAMPHTQAAS